MSWQDVRKKWLDKAFIPADRSGLIEPLKANVVNLWNSRPKLPPVWQYRWWWLKNWTMAIGTSIAVWQGAVLLARPSEPARLDDVMTMIPTLHAAIWKMVARDIGRPMELARDPRVYHVRDSSIYARSDEIRQNKYFGYFMEARPQGVPYEVTISEHWSLLHGKKPSQPPPPTPSAELRSEIIAPYVDMSEREETSDESSVEQQWTFSPWSHEHLLTIKFYVHSLRDLVEHFAEEAGYDFSYLMQPYNWTRVTAVLAMPEPGSVKPYQLKSVTIYDRIHDSSLVWGEVEKDFRLFEVTSYDSWRWNPTGVPIAAPSLDYAEVLTRYMPRWATRRPDAEALAQNSGWSVKMFHSWPLLSAQTLSTTTGADNKDKPLPAQYDDLYEAVDPGNSARMRENMAKVYNPSLTGRWAHEYVGLHDIK